MLDDYTALRLVEVTLAGFFTLSQNLTRRFPRLGARGADSLTNSYYRSLHCLAAMQPAQHGKIDVGQWISLHLSSLHELTRYRHELDLKSHVLNVRKIKSTLHHNE